MNEAKLNTAHKHSIFNRSELESSIICGCFYCKGIFEPKKIYKWHKECRASKISGEKKEDTALCPQCGIDSVIGDVSNFPINEHFLEEMRERFFER